MFFQLIISGLILLGLIYLLLKYIVQPYFFVSEEEECSEDPEIKARLDKKKSELESLSLKNKGLDEEINVTDKLLSEKEEVKSKKQKLEILEKDNQ